MKLRSFARAHKVPICTVKALHEGIPQEKELEMDPLLFKMADYLKDMKTLKKDDILYLNNLAKKYKINTKNIHKIDLVNELLHSVDIIPNSIVLAQAANESGWGTSRFAKEYNALFGQYTYDENNGVIPFDRDEGK